MGGVSTAPSSGQGGSLSGEQAAGLVTQDVKGGHTGGHRPGGGGSARLRPQCQEALRSPDRPAP